MRIKKAALAAAMLIAAGALAFLAIRRGDAPAKAQARGPAAAAAPAASEAKPVKVAAAAVGTLRPYIDASGDVEALVNVDVFPDIGGKVVEYKVALGDRVEKGQAIALVDPSKPGSAYALSAVGSPISGTVTSILAQQGETVASSSSLAKVGQVDQLKVVVKLAERDSAKAAVGMSARVSFEALPGESFAATVSRVSPVLDATSRTREIWLAFSAKEGRISAGMYAKVRLYTDPVSGSLVIPAEAVTLRGGESFVYVAASRDGERIAERRAVKTGTAVDGKLAVLAGLAEGDSVVYEGQGNISDGARVTVVGEAAR